VRAAGFGGFGDVGLHAVDALRWLIGREPTRVYARIHAGVRRAIGWFDDGKKPGFPLVQTVRELLIDDDQDCIWLRVDVAGGASCHVGYRSCFYRKVPVGKDFASKQADGNVELEWTEAEKVFDPEDVYGDAPNPTVL